MADVAFVKSKEKSAGRAGAPTKGFDAGGCKYNVCPSDSPDLHGLLCRKTLKDIYLPAALLRVPAQIRRTIQAKLMGPDPNDPDNGLRLDWETSYECNVLF